MINQVGVTTSVEDPVRKDPAQLATKLKDSFDEYYKNRIKELDRKEKDLQVLKERAGVKTTNTPSADNNLVSLILTSIGN